MPPKKVKVVDVTNDDNDNDNDANHDENTVEEQPEVIEANTEELSIDTIPEQPESESTEEEAIVTPKPQPEPEEKKDVRVNELVECTKCGKKMTKKTLKYTHEKTCPANPDKKQTKTKPVQEIDTEEIVPQQAPPPTKLERQKSTYIQQPMERHTPILEPAPQLSFEEMRRIRLKQRMDQRTQNHMSLFANAI